MPGKKNLEEEYQKIEKEEVEDKIEKAKAENKHLKKLIINRQIKQLRYDVLYIIIISIVLGFILWAWKPSQFSYTKALALGLAWYLLFDELKLHKMFKKE